VNDCLVLVDDDGEEYEVEASDVEEDADGSGVWLLAAGDEEFEYFYEYADEEDCDDEEDDFEDE